MHLNGKGYKATLEGENKDDATSGDADVRADCTGHVVPGARPCALGTFSYLVSSTSYFRLSYPNRLL